MGTLERALQIAADGHAGTVDKAGNPYVLHPLRVMLQMTTPVARIVAVLHDVLEDTRYTADDLRAAGFGDEVISALEALTWRSSDGEEYEDFIRRAARNPIARVVKVADIRDNLDRGRIANFTSKDEARFERYRQALALLQSLES